MSDSSDHTLRKGQSFTISKCPRASQSAGVCRSDFNVDLLNELAIISRANVERSKSIQHNAGFGEYYKRYEHDEMPVKDCDANEIGDRASLTNSVLDKLEIKIFNNVSQELQTDDSTITSLESNIKFFKTTVQEIFDNFYTSMQDFELYKKRFQEILNKTREESVAEMEDFIKDMIHHIMSSETVSHETHKSTDSTSESKDVEMSIDNSEVSTTNTTASGQTGVLEAYKNDNYMTDSTNDDNNSKIESSMKQREIFNIYLLSGAPCVQIKMNDRHLLSEINIKEPSIRNGSRGHVASAENLKTLAAKKFELEEYVQQQEYNLPDKEIPVKVSYAKKNIHLNEDFMIERDGEANRSFMAKLCNFLCKKFRKNSFV